MSTPSPYTTADGVVTKPGDTVWLICPHMLTMKPRTVSGDDDGGPFFRLVQNRNASRYCVFSTERAAQVELIRLAYQDIKFAKRELALGKKRLARLLSPSPSGSPQ